MTGRDISNSSFEMSFEIVLSVELLLLTEESRRKVNDEFGVRTGIRCHGQLSVELKYQSTC
jgi:hypothetical protein